MANAIIRNSVPAVTIAADTTTPLGACPFDGFVIRATYTARAAVAGAASPDSRTVNLINRGQAGAGAVVVATRPIIVGASLEDNVEGDLTLGVAANLIVNRGDVLDWESLAVTGAGGLVDPGGTVEVTIRPALN